MQWKSEISEKFRNGGQWPPLRGLSFVFLIMQQAPKLSLFDRQLNLRQPVLYIFLVPDTVDVALPEETCHLITVLHSIAVDVGIGFSQTGRPSPF